jgi:hypothetical protein
MVSYGKRYALRSLTVSEGMGRASSARLTGMDRRTLRDGVHRDNAEGIAGLCNRPTRGRKPKLTEGQTPVLKAVVLPGPRSGSPTVTAAGSATAKRIPPDRDIIGPTFNKRKVPQPALRLFAHGSCSNVYP